jgi:hypothetical protein
MHCLVDSVSALFPPHDKYILDPLLSTIPILWLNIILSILIILVDHNIMCTTIDI